MRILDYEFCIKSMSVMSQDVYCVQLYPGETMEERDGCVFVADQPVTMVVDRLAGNTCTMIRQVVEGHDVQYVDIPCDRRMRNLCLSRGAEEIYCPGGFTPITKIGTVAVPNFAMSGTKYLLMPEKIYDEIMQAREIERERES